jgi:hypothetical protein
MLQESSFSVAQSWVVALAAAGITPDIQLLVGNECRPLSECPALTAHAADGYQQWREEKRRELVLQALDHGFEFVSLPYGAPNSSSEGAAISERRGLADMDNRDTEGVERVHEALSCHMWATMTRKPRGGAPGGVAMAAASSLVSDAARVGSDHFPDFPPLDGAASMELEKEGKEDEVAVATPEDGLSFEERHALHASRTASLPVDKPAAGSAATPSAPIPAVAAGPMPAVAVRRTCLLLDMNIFFASY